MLGSRRTTALVIGGLASLCSAGYPKAPEDVTVLKSRFNNGITISYREPGLCETTPGVKSYSGYIYLPPGTLEEELGQKQDFPINTFFWFFESRKDPQNAPLSIWMNGGPGSSSLYGLLTENGPCFVNPDSNSTRLNPWSWNNEVNMLYLDQPVQAGFSYDTLANYTVDLLTGQVQKAGANAPPADNGKNLLATFPSSERNSTSRGSRNAAVALWHFAQTWFQEFPGYHPNNSRISLATESYGGRYGPAIMSFFEEQNQKIESGTSQGNPGEQFLLNLDTLLIVNGCIDRLVQWPSYPQQAYNNTYGIKAVSESTYKGMVDAFSRPGGCRDQIKTCQAAATVSDPDNTGRNATVNSLCQQAESYCGSFIKDQYTRTSGRGYYDITQFEPIAFPYGFYRGWLNREHVQRALGVPLNFTQSSNAVSTAFRGIGDYNRPGWLEDLAFLLHNDIKVALMFGDRDFACNWLGGEAVSLAINHTDAASFRAAGYAPIVTNATYSGGQVRQHGNLSFSRVYQSGHEVPSYQPETAYHIFMRALFDKDIATGTVETGGGNEYSSTGPPDTWAVTFEPPEQEPRFCYLYDTSTCNDDQINSVTNGTAVIRDWILVDKDSIALFPELASG